MALDDRGFASEQFVDLTCGTESISPYSSSGSFTDAPAYYQSDYEWQHAHLPQHQTLSYQAHLLENERHHYSEYADENDSRVHAYSSYGNQSVNHPDIYTPSQGLWAAEKPGDQPPTGQISQHHLFFSGLDLSQQCVVPQTNSSTNNGKPKRKRVQSHSQRKAANVRERRRMFHLNEAFDELRKRLPAFNYEKRLSRIETLRLAMTYISFMKEVSVGQDPKYVKLKPHGADLSPMPGSSGSLLASPHPSYMSSDNTDDCNLNEDSDCSNDELSNHSEGNC